MKLKEVDKSLFFSKNDSKDPRIGDFAKIFSTKTQAKKTFLLMGYPDDEGIQNNGGRIGASHAPDTIRKYFYKMTPHLLQNIDFQILDCGNLAPSENGTLFERHEKAATHLEKLLDISPTITLGGGHDYGYADGKAFLNKFKKENPLIINFDAHLDVRPVTKDKISSGTPFYRLLSEFSDFDFLEVGIQSQCNSKAHFEWALGKKAKILTWDEIMYCGKNLSTKILEFFEPYVLKKRPTYLSIDIDGFSSSFAPGASQSFATGFNPEYFLPVFKVLCQRLDVKLLGIYEVSPPLDQDDRTSKLAAQLIFERIFS